MSVWDFFAKIAYYLAKPLMRVFVRNSRRVRVLITDDEGRIVLIRSSFGPQKWTIPGGGIGRHESDVSACAREVEEETGLVIPTGDLSHVVDWRGDEEKLPFIAVVYVAKIANNHEKIMKNHRRFEIIEQKWFNRYDLPSGRAKLVDVALEKAAESLLV